MTGRNGYLIFINAYADNIEKSLLQAGQLRLSSFSKKKKKEARQPCNGNLLILSFTFRGELSHNLYLNLLGHHEKALVSGSQ